ncbi:hypothetical protein D3C81_2246790 [compost metagenome]
MVDALAVLGDRHPAGGAVQQAHAEVFLEQAHALADKGRRGIQFGRCGGEAAAPSDQNEDPQVLKGRQTVHEVCSMNQQID